VFSPVQALSVACWIGLLFYALGLLRLTRVLELRSHEQWLLVVVGLITAPIPVHWLNGLETSCALAAVTWTLSFVAGKSSCWLAAALFAGVSASLRPDLLPFALLMTGLLTWQSVRSSEPKDGMIRALTMAFAVAAPILVCGFWYFHLTGSPIPLTGVAKRYFFAENHEALTLRLVEMVCQLVLFVVGIGPLALTLVWMGKSALGRMMLAVWALFVIALFLQFPDQFCVNEFRYPVVLIPTLLWGIGWTLKNTVPGRRRWGERLMYACAVYAVLMLPVCFHFYSSERAFFEAGQRPVARWCEQHLAPGTSILVHDAGYLAYSTGFHTIDFVGLKTPAAIALNRQYTWPSGGRDRDVAVSKLASASGARYMVLNSHWGPVIPLAAQLRALGWKVELLGSEGAFQIFRITPPAA
jgi:hypothetical protein